MRAGCDDENDGDYDGAVIDGIVRTLATSARAHR